MSATPSTTQIDLRHVLRVVRERKWVIIASVLVVPALAVGLAFTRTPIYQSSALILIQKQGASDKLDPSARPVNQNQDVAAETEIQFLKSQGVRRAATEQLGYDASATASTSGKAVVIRVTATNTDPQKAADTANAFAQAYLDVRRDSMVNDYLAAAEAVKGKVDALNDKLNQLEARISGPEAKAADVTSSRAEQQALITQKGALQESLDRLQVNAELAQGGGPQIIGVASVPNRPISPNPGRSLALGMLAGLILGTAAAVLLDYFDDSIRNREDLEVEAGGVTTLALIPNQEGWRNKAEAHVISLEEPSSPTAEAYRSLRTSVQFAGLERPIRVLQVTSSQSQDGKSTTVANLAVVLARAGQRVVLVDCDLRRPRLHEFFGLSNEVGLTSVLLGEVSIIDAIRPVSGQDRLRILPSGPVPPDPSELLSSQRTASLLEAIKEAADIVLIDSPPVLPVTDALLISDLADAVIVIVKAGTTGRKEIGRSLELLEQVNAPVIGTALNGVESGKGFYGRTYGYDYGDGPTHRLVTKGTEGSPDQPRQGREPSGAVREAPVSTQSSQ